MHSAHYMNSEVGVGWGGRDKIGSRIWIKCHCNDAD